MGDFKEDLQKGEEWERVIIRLLNDKSIFSLEQVKARPDYDLIDTKTNLKFEVKYDEMSQKTSNVAIEIGTKQNPKGLTNTRAYYWVHIWYLNESVVYNIIPTHELKRFVKKFIREITISHKAGDGDATICLVPKRVFKHWRIYGEIPRKYLTVEK
jgi:hypothetical protein